jgi:hypothetical protein
MDMALTLDADCGAVRGAEHVIVVAEWHMSSYWKTL